MSELSRRQHENSGFQKTGKPIFGKKTPQILVENRICTIDNWPVCYTIPRYFVHSRVERDNWIYLMMRLKSVITVYDSDITLQGTI